MIQTEFHTDQLFNSLALGRFSIHKEEIKRALLPILQEVYEIGYDRGVADANNNLLVEESHRQEDVIDLLNNETESIGTITANVEVINHSVEEEDQCEQSSLDQPESSADTSSES